MAIVDLPTLDSIDGVQKNIAPFVQETPVIDWSEDAVRDAVGVATSLSVKLELFQNAGSFKARGAVNNLLQLEHDQRQRGVTAVSAGNHAIATAYAAQVTGSHAKVVMPASVNRMRVERCKSLGAEVVLSPDVAAAFAEIRRIEVDEGRYLVHPFEGLVTLMGPATLAREWLRQSPDLEAIVVPCGGGGLISGMALALHQIKPRLRIFAVEPDGAATMGAAWRAGVPVETGANQTIADSLAPPPPASANNLAICQAFVEDFVTVSDAAMQRSMGVIFDRLKLAVEPAPAAGLAAIAGPLASRLDGVRTGLLMCGANIDAVSFAAHLTASH
jgi:threonine dehydratase